MIMEPTSAEKRSVAAIAAIFACRMLGLFMILPLFSLYAPELRGSTPTLMGLALGIYGLTQALLQIPFGMSSDRYGRKTVITLGLLLFALGSLIAATTHSIYGMIIGRGLQGAGAIGSTLIALIADLTTEKNRTKAMAFLGMSIGISFALAMIVGPLLNQWMRLSGIFWLTAGLAILAIGILHTLVPTPRHQQFHPDAETNLSFFKQVLYNPELQRLNLGIFTLHTILTALFMVLPITLQHSAGIQGKQQWFIYLPILIGSFVTMLPFIIVAEKKGYIKPIFLGAIALMFIATTLLGLWHTQLQSLVTSLFFYFTAFNLLEATLPSLISKIAPAHCKGTAMGIYSSAQFLGIFCGGALGGWLYGQHHITGVFYACAALALGWLLIALTMQAPQPRYAVGSQE